MNLKTLRPIAAAAFVLSLAACTAQTGSDPTSPEAESTGATSQAISNADILTGSIQGVGKGPNAVVFNGSRFCGARTCGDTVFVGLWNGSAWTSSTTVTSTGGLPGGFSGGGFISGSFSIPCGSAPGTLYAYDETTQTWSSPVSLTGNSCFVG